MYTKLSWTVASIKLSPIKVIYIYYLLEAILIETQPDPILTYTLNV